MSEKFTTREDTIVCPHCKYRYQEAYEYPDYGTEECVNCGKKFEYHRDIIYGTSAKEP